MTSESNQYEQKLQELKHKYLLELPPKLSNILAQIDIIIRTLSNEDSLDESLPDLKRALHTIAGSSGVFGFTELSQQIRKIENQLIESLDQGQDVQILQKIRLDVNQLLEMYDKQSKDTIKKENINASNTPSPNQDFDDEMQSKCVILCGFDDLEEEKVHDQLLYFGYKPVILSHINDIDTHNFTGTWMIAVINCAGCNQKEIKTITDQFNLKYNHKVPLIFCHGSGSFSDRYLAATFECEKYHSGDLDGITLVESIEEIYSSYCGLPERILAIDDDHDLIEYLRIFFQKEGFEFCSCTQPERLLDMISDFNPELILMDLNMPYYEGAYLASVVRQLDQWSSIPVLYLSSEIDMKKIHFAMSKGADDFILKPFDDQELVFIIKYKIQRYRFLKKHISKDGLTGLLKHSVIKHSLDAELERAERLNHTVSAIMVDLDNFKEINDQYGHAVGDQVLSSLSKLFKNRFRKCDLIGRYGGEEFLIILPICTPSNAKKILDGILEDFARLEFVAGDKTFNVTFSAGISSSDVGDGSASTILKQADSLLYKAKSKGKNLVLIE